MALTHPAHTYLHCAQELEETSLMPEMDLIGFE